MRRGAYVLLAAICLSVSGCAEDDIDDGPPLSGERLMEGGGSSLSDTFAMTLEGKTVHMKWREDAEDPFRLAEAVLHDDAHTQLISLREAIAADPPETYNPGTADGNTVRFWYEPLDDEGFIFLNIDTMDPRVAELYPLAGDIFEGIRTCSENGSLELVTCN